MIFGDLITRIKGSLPDASAGGLVKARDAINDSILMLARDHPLDVWKIRSGEVTADDYTTGTVTATQGSCTVAGAGTTWTNDMRGRGIIIQGYDNLCRVMSVESPTSLTIDVPYAGTTTASLTYAIYDDQPVLRHDVTMITSASLPTMGRILELKREICVNNSYIHMTDTGTPQYAYIAGYSTWPKYNVGGVTVTGGSAALTGSGTAWISDHTHRWFRIVGSSREYKIKNILSGTSMTLDETYGEASGAGKTYFIDPQPNPLLGLYPLPTSSMYVAYTGYRRPKKLYNDNDLPETPESWDTLIVSMAKYNLRKNRGEPSDALMLEKADYTEQYKRLFGRNPIDVGRTCQMGLYTPDPMAGQVTAVTLPSDWGYT